MSTAGRTLLLAALVLAAGCDGGRPARPNLVLISLDTCRRDRLGCYGYDRPTTPRLDELARDCVVFEDCLSQSTATAPSHASLLSGQYVRRHGLLVNGQASYPQHTLAQSLLDAGWATAAFTGNGSFQRIFGHGVGFETFQSWPGPEYKDRPFTHRTRNLSDVIPFALDWLDERDPEVTGKPRQPFFLLVHGYDPHCPYEPPAAYARGLVSPYDGSLDLVSQCGMAGFQDVVARKDFVSSPDGRHLSEVYDAEIRTADDAIGRLLDALRERGLLEESIVVFTSDHGELLGEHAWVGHTRIYEPELRVPLLVRFPGGELAGRFDDPVEHVDLYPTLLSYLGLPRPPGLQGVDLMPRLSGRAEAPPTERMRLAQIGPLVTVRFDTRYKAVFGEDPRHVLDGGALFDLETDPAEEHNLIDTPAGRASFDGIRARYDAWDAAVAPEDALFTGTARELTPDEERGVRAMIDALGYGGGD